MPTIKGLLTASKGDGAILCDRLYILKADFEGFSAGDLFYMERIIEDGYPIPMCEFVCKTYYQHGLPLLRMRANKLIAFMQPLDRGVGFCLVCNYVWPEDKYHFCPKCEAQFGARMPASKMTERERLRELRLLHNTCGTWIGQVLESLRVKELTGDARASPHDAIEDLEASAKKYAANNFGKTAGFMPSGNPTTGGSSSRGRASTTRKGVTYTLNLVPPNSSSQGYTLTPGSFGAAGKSPMDDDDDISP